eukprot:1170799-Rhodomonas_salina.1
MTSKSTCCFAIFINDAQIVWKSGRLPLVTLSSAESEYVQLTLACQEILHMQEDSRSERSTRLKARTVVRSGVRRIEAQNLSTRVQDRSMVQEEPVRSLSSLASDYEIEDTRRWRTEHLHVQGRSG